MVFWKSKLIDQIFGANLEHKFTQCSYRQNRCVSCTCESVGLPIEHCEPRMSRTEFVVLVEGKPEPFIICIRYCQVPCLVLKMRRVRALPSCLCRIEFHLEEKFRK